MIHIKALDLFIGVYLKDYKRLRDIAYSILLNTFDVEDVMQAVMLKIVEKQDALDDISNPEAYLSRCIRNEAISLLRHKRIAAVPNTDSINDYQAPYIDDEFDKVENLLYVKAYIKKEPPEIQNAFISYVIDGYPIVDIAKDMNMDANVLARKFRKIKVEVCHKRGVRFTGIIIVIC